MSWLRVRFKSDCDDFRPIYTPPEMPEGPWWCTGYSENDAVLVAYVKDESTIYKQWPEAFDLDIEHVSGPEFSSRFPKPDWWKD